VKQLKWSIWAALGVSWLIATSSFAAEVKTYQVTGPVVEVTASSITVQKGNEKWEIARTKDTKISAEPKVGEKVTISYRMIAADVEVKAGKTKK
jgi:hypothetical protein